MNRAGYNRWRAVGMIVAATLMWSLMAPISKSLFAQGVAPLMAVTVRTTLGALILAVGLRLIRGAWSGVARRDYLLLICYGLFIAGNYLTYFKSFEVGTVTVAVVALHVYPAFVVIGARLFHGEPLTVRRWTAFAAAAIGVILLAEVGSVDGFVNNAAGAVWGVVSALFLAGHVLLAKELVKRYDPYTTVQYGLAVAAAFLLIPCWLSGNVVTINAGTIGLFAALVLVSTVGAYCLFTRAIQDLPVGRSGIITFLEMVWVMAWGRFLLEEIATPVQLMGAALVLAGVMFVIGEPQSQTIVVDEGG